MRGGSTIVALTLAALLAPGVAAQQAEREEGLKDFEELTRGATAIDGFFDLHRKGDRLWLVVPADRLGDDFLMEMKIAQGIGAGGLFGGTMLDIFEGKLVSLERHGDRVVLLQRPHRFGAPTDAAAARAVQLTFSPSVLESAKIESIREDGALVIPVQNWFLSDLSNVGQRVRRAADGNAPLNQERSYIEDVKSFPENTNILAKLTFRPADPPSLSSVPDNRSISVSVHYTLAALPAEPMEPRPADDRIGSFMTVHKDFSSLDSTFFARNVNRWRLEPGERRNGLWQPVEPITYYIDPTVPEAYRAVFKEGVEAWNSAFEAAGFTGAIRALDLPEDADAEDIRYATLRWNTSDRSGYGAIGPSVVDPRTGEILDADILFEASMFQGHRTMWRGLANRGSAAEALEQALGVGPYASAPDGHELEGFASAFMDQGALLGTALAARGEIGPADPVPEEFLMQAAKWVVMHEVGHTLGLQHNFRSSASTPFERLHDRAWAEENGLYSSVMEYPTVNLAPPGQGNGYFYTPGAGSYDRWAIAYAYTPDVAEAARIAREAADPRHLFGTNAESGGSGALDPSINTYDLSDDPLAWAAQRTEIVAGLWNRLPDYVLTDNESYYTLTNAYNGLLRDYARAVAPAVKYIGGQYINRDHVGDPNGRLPFENVPVAEQREALRLIVDRVFAADALVPPRAVLARLGSNRWLHWGEQNTFDGRLDYPFHEEIVDLQASLLGQLFQPQRLSRIRDAETKFGATSVVSIPELMNALTDAIWSDLDANAAIPATRRDLQRVHLDALIALAVRPEDAVPADATSVARAQLRVLAARIGPSDDGAGPVDYTNAHLADAAARIEQALDAPFPTVVSARNGNGGN